MTSETNSIMAPPAAAAEDGTNRITQVETIANKFDRDPNAILAALSESQRTSSSEEDVIIILPIVEVENAIFPPFEFRARWRLAYCRATVSRNSARLTSRTYFTSAPETFAKLSAEGRLITWSGIALRDEIGKPAYKRASPSLFRIGDAPKSEMALRSFVARAFDAGDYPLRPPGDWAGFLLDCLAQFYPVAAQEVRATRYPWEALPGPTNSLMADVRDRAAEALHDPTALLRKILAS